MPRGLNKVMLIGSLGREPEMRYTPSGTPVTTFSLAVSRAWLTTEGDRETTDWFNVVAWRRLAEICNEQLSQDSRVYIEGRLQTRAWDDADGRRHHLTEVVVTEMIPLDEHQPGESVPESHGEDDGPEVEDEVPDDS